VDVVWYLAGRFPFFSFGNFGVLCSMYCYTIICAAVLTTCSAWLALGCWPWQGRLMGPHIPYFTPPQSHIPGGPHIPMFVSYVCYVECVCMYVCMYEYVACFRCVCVCVTADKRQQTTDSRRQMATSRQQIAERRQQTADSRQQTGGSRWQTAESRQQTADSRQQTADSRQQTADRNKQTADKPQACWLSRPGRAPYRPCYTAHPCFLQWY
jgi:hypothetical protein